MSSPLFLILFAIIQNIDNLVLAGAYRLRRVRIPAAANAVIAVLSGVATGGGVLLACLGQAGPLQAGVGKFSETIGRGLLVMIGVWTLVSYLRARLLPPLAEAPSERDERHGKDVRGMTASESLVPALALAADNLAPSFAFGMLYAQRQGIVELSALLAVLTTTISVLAVWLGQTAVGRYGGKSLRWLPTEVISGCLLIVIALLDPGDFFHDWIRR